MKAKCLAILGVILLLGSDAPRFDDRAEMDLVGQWEQGTWEQVTIEGWWQGTYLITAGVDGQTLKFHNGQYTLTGPIAETGPYKVQAHFHLNLNPSSGHYAGKTREAKYQIKGDTLKIIFQFTGDGRPDSF